MTDEVLGTRLKAELLVYLGHGILVQIDACSFVRPEVVAVATLR